MIMFEMIEMFEKRAFYFFCVISICQESEHEILKISEKSGHILTAFSYRDVKSFKKYHWQTNLCYNHFILAYLSKQLNML